MPSITAHFNYLYLVSNVSEQHCEVNIIKLEMITLDSVNTELTNTYISNSSWIMNVCMHRWVNMFLKSCHVKANTQNLELVTDCCETSNYQIPVSIGNVCKSVI